MTKKQKPQPNDKEQSQRFVETAKMLGMNECEKAFEKTFREIVPRISMSKKTKSRQR